LQLFCLTALVACATGEPANRQSEPAMEERAMAEPDMEEIRRALGCSSDQVAICIDADCEPDEYVCGENVELRNLFEPRISRGPTG